MARTKKNEEVENENIATGTLSAETKEVNSEIETMKAEIEQLKALLAKNATSAKTTAEVANDYGSKYIKVVSLFDGVLNLNSGANGSGKLFTLNGVGKSWKILESELRDVVMNNRSFFEKGYCYIDDKNFVKEVDLDGVYDHILDAKGFLDIYNGDKSKVAIEMFNHASEEQKKNLIDIFVRKIIAGELPERVANDFDPDGSFGIKEKVKDSKGMLSAYKIDAKEANAKTEEK
jgi:hypothetical protein